ncbi:MAG TPA: hypothetical protein VFH78_05540 [Candidatus Thermoplasmatota archaeon]|nr:hypothetical protein [Candidatus Thermoplasmatota archaeon]
MDRSDDTNYECFCGDGFDSREQLMSHNVSSHGMGEGDSRRAVIEKYPE